MSKYTFNDVLLLPFIIIYLFFVCVFCWIYITCYWCFSNLNSAYQQVISWLN